MQNELDIKPIMTQVDINLIQNQPTFTAALKFCQQLSGKEDKCFFGDGRIVKDSAQWSRIMTSQKHFFPQDKLNAFMDICGNEVPLLWLIHQRGYDVHSLRKIETETEKALRLEQERSAALERENEILRSAISGRR